MNHGRIGIGRLQRMVAGLPLPRVADGRLVLAVDASKWLRPGAVTSRERLFCHVHGRGKRQAQVIPGWPYSVIAALEPGRTSRTAVTAVEPSAARCGGFRLGGAPLGGGQKDGHLLRRRWPAIR